MDKTSTIPTVYPGDPIGEYQGYETFYYNNKTLKVKLKSSRFPIPEKATSGSAAYDLRANLGSTLELKPNERKTIGTGIYLELPENTFALVLPRSGLSTKFGITLSNSVGLIDSDYRGELLISLVNQGDTVARIEDGTRIAQMLILTQAPTELISVQSVEDTVRGSGGFGSTGVE